MAWVVAGILALLFMTLELFHVTARMSRWALAGSMILLMGLFPVAGAVPHLYARLVTDQLTAQELVLGTTLGLTSVLATDTNPLSSTLLMITTIGGIVAVSANNWLVLFLGIETINVGIYGLMGQYSRTRIGDEALLKFFLLGTIFTACEVAGIGLIGGVQGSLQILRSETGHPSLIFGLSVVLAALLFKMGSFPFHLWAPDTYEGTPWATTTIIATLPKIVAGTVLIRLVAHGTFAGLPHESTMWDTVALGTMIVGALGAWRQQRLKRMLAYAAISQIGFVLMPLSEGHPNAALIYLVTYILISLAMLTAAQALSGPTDPRRLDLVGALHTKNRWAAVALILSLAGFGGFPFTLGMVAKLYSVEAVMKGPPIVWLGSLLVTGFTFLYYFRWIYPLFAPGSRELPQRPIFSITMTSQVAAWLIVILGIWTYPMTWLTENWRR